MFLPNKFTDHPSIHQLSTTYLGPGASNLNFSMQQKNDYIYMPCSHHMWSNGSECNMKWPHL